MNDITGEHLIIRRGAASPSGKTHTYTVENKSTGSMIGSIGWWYRWRKYVFYPHTDTLWDASCLREITVALDKLMKERDPAHKKLQREAAAAMVADMYGEGD